MKAKIELTREPAENGWNVTGSIRGNTHDLIDLVAYVIMDIATTTEVPPPEILIDVVRGVKALHMSGAWERRKGEVKGMKYDATTLQKALEKLKDMKEDGGEDHE